jgi:hypothetical protein
MPRRAVPVVRTGSSEFGRERLCLAHGNDPLERFQVGMAGRGIRSRVSREARGYWGGKFRWVVNHDSRLARRRKRRMKVGRMVWAGWCGPDGVGRMVWAGRRAWGTE